MEGAVGGWAPGTSGSHEQSPDHAGRLFLGFLEAGGFERSS